MYFFLHNVLLYFQPTEAVEEHLIYLLILFRDLFLVITFLLFVRSWLKSS